ncbi:pilus (MSHA type) biogenesis protein MshL [Janthinobacterium sp. 17J80-10]|uniref:pilus (MSHA type) biogenesis protein MshL n=1 Tax=Janthinobacterium sp. 17J80-10 TaxID=2497863 RepID=UPI00100599A7|nr:pilus (MSHA type) biogenesis protein MshL [Janthinobacterium sp. 17J80-10]QAU34281.1 pilus (MSHA type) biogenesis protein MshL [Janthinobacterium sp. 17J80-10]
MNKIISIIVVASLAGCSSVASRRDTYDAINAEIAKAATESKARPADKDAVSAALLPPLNIEIPKPKQPLEERFSLAFNAVPAQQFFMAIVTGTRYSMLVHPEVSGVISANLKDVTVLEALDAIREQYGYDYKVEGTRIYVKSLGMQTRVFKVNYLTGNRKGTSEIRVSSGSVSDLSSTGASTAGAATTTTSPGTSARALESSKISTSSNNDFWGDLKSSLDAIVGSGKEGRSVVVSPQSGVVVVRAGWNELRDVAEYLKATQLSVGRQVILEAKILEVQLSDGYQTGVNWAAFRAGNHSNRASFGVLTPGTALQPNGPLIGSQIATNSAGQDLIAAANPAAIAGGLFGLAFQTSNFAALLSFLETQGSVHVLSSPRIATLNNQKAVLKVGRDEFFVTNVSTTTTTGTSTTTSPSVTVQPFFSGVALDVTPQIDEDGNIILHIHPSVSEVTTVDKPINLGSAGTFSLPLASSAVSETDSIVRGRDGQIVAIGGLMRQAAASDRSQMPGVGSVPVLGNLFGNTNRSTQKRELVILLKPTVVDGNQAWTQDLTESQRRIQALEPPPPLEQRNPLQ